MGMGQWFRDPAGYHHNDNNHSDDHNCPDDINNDINNDDINNNDNDFINNDDNPITLISIRDQIAEASDRETSVKENSGALLSNSLY